MNADSAADLIFQHEDGTLGVWHIKDRALISAELLTPKHPGDSPWRVVASGDLNCDGKSDLILQHADGRLAVWHMTGSRLLRGEYFRPLSAGAGWQVVGIANYFKDNCSDDIVFQHTDGTIAIWYMSGHNLLRVESANPRQADRGWRIVGPR